MTDKTTILEIRSEPSELAKIFEAIEGFCRQRNLPDSLKYKLFLVAEELAVNSITHGYGGQVDRPIILALSDDTDGVTFQYQDEAPEFDVLADSHLPDLTSELEDRPIGGLGVYLIKTLSNTSSYKRSDGRNIVTATFLY